MCQSLVALDDGDHATNERFDVASKRLRGGMLQAIIRAGREPGEVEVSFEADGLQPAKLAVALKIGAKFIGGVSISAMEGGKYRNIPFRHSCVPCPERSEGVSSKPQTTMEHEMDDSNPKLKIYCETSFWSYLVGGPTSDEKVARWQALTRKWWENERQYCTVFVSEYVVQEARIGNVSYAEKRIESMAESIKLGTFPNEIVPIAEKLLSAHALPPDEKTDALHIATAAYQGIDVLLTWNCRHLANLFTLPKTIAVISSLGLKCPLITTPERYLEDIHHDED